MSGQETPGVILDLAPTPVPSAASVGGARGIVQAAGGWLGLIRFLPGALRQVFSGREPVGGLPVVEPGQTPAPRVPEIDFGESFPTADHGLPAETALTTSRPNRCATSNAWLGPHFAGDAEQQRYEAWLAQAATAEAGVSAESAETVVTGEQLRQEWLAGHDAGTELQDLIEAHTAEEAEQGYQEWLAQEQADFDAGTGPYAADPAHLAQVDAEAGDGPHNGQASAQVAVAQAGAELGEVGLGEAGL